MAEKRAAARGLSTPGILLLSATLFFTFLAGSPSPLRAADSTYLDGVPIMLPEKMPVPVKGAEIKLATKDGLSLALDSSAGIVSGIEIAGKDYSFPESKAFSGLFFRQPGSDNFYQIKGAVQKEKDGSYVQQQEFPKKSLSFKTTYASSPDTIKITTRVQSTDGQEKAVSLYFALPIDATGWQWWDTLATKKTITGKAEYLNGRERENTGVCSSYPLSALSGEVNLSYAVSLDEPRVFRIVYNPTFKLYYICFDLGLSPLTKKFPAQASASFIIYKNDPVAWGLRSALQKYYRLFPENFVRRVTREGIWMVSVPINKIENADDFGFAFMEGSGRCPKYDDEHGIYTLDYNWLQSPSVPFYQFPKGYEDWPSDKKLAYLKNLAAAGEGAGKTRAEQILATALEDKDGRLSSLIHGEGNPDPEIPDSYMIPRRSFSDALLIRDSSPETGIYDGSYYDGLNTNAEENFNKAHFAYADVPLSFDYQTGRPVMMNSFACYKEIKGFMERWRAKEKFMMGNGFPPSFPFVAKWVDIGGAEITGPPEERESLLGRALLSKKPYCVLLKADHDQLELSYYDYFMQKCLFYGIYPSAFDTMGGGGVGSYFENPKWYNQGRPLFKKYVPLIQEINRGGWEPVTGARTNDSEVKVERFAGADKSVTAYLTIFNDSDESKDVSVSLDNTLDVSPKDKLVNMLGQEELTLSCDQKTQLFSFDITLGKKEVRLVKIEKTGGTGR